MNRCLIAVIALALMCTRLYAWEIEGFYWLPVVDGDIEVGAGALPGEKLDVEDDLGLDDEEDVFGLSVIAGDRHQVGATIFNFDVSARNVLDRRVRFGDAVFPDGTMVTSKLDAFFARAFYRLNAGTEEISGGLIVGLQYADVNAKITSATDGEKFDDVVGIAPLIGAFAQAHPFYFIGFRLSLMGAQLTLDDVDMEYSEFDAAVQLYATPDLIASIGYKYMSFSGSDDGQPADADFTLDGPALSLLYRW